eukprot:TRINITY_DN23496_c0_g1_i1.p1 TRINITY_DN23496_c0_g1~~TRINITY_DN23496_c0_g1_i1.p1  ORF type:complete len:435 (+),score=117.74 TRINITY_DN23496_c0_g1_i1:128-1432(+)
MDSGFGADLSPEEMLEREMRDARRPSRSRSRGNNGGGSSSSSSEPQKRKKSKLRTGGFWDSKDGTKVVEKQKKRRQKGSLKIFKGASVDLLGLVGAAQYNGCEALVVEGPNEKGRWKVLVQFQCEERELALKPENLRPKPSCGWELAVPSHPTLGELDMSRTFAKFGSLRGISSEEPRSVQMSSREDAEAALRALQGQPLNGELMRVEWSAKAKTEMGLEQLSEGSWVLVCGLKGAPQHNGKIGRATAAAGPASERCQVELDDGEGGKKVLALKLENLIPMRGADQESPAAATGPPAAPAPAAAQQPPAAAAPGAGAGEEAAAAGDPAADAGGAPRQRRRKSAWGGENEGGVVYVKSSADTAAAAKTPADGGSVSGPATSFAPCSAPLLPEAELKAMSAGQLKQLLAKHGISALGCVEKADYLNRALNPSSKAA